jgi:hypothetical protein
MTTLELDDDEKAAIVALLTAEIETSRYPLSPRIKAAKAILAKLEPAPITAAAIPTTEAGR